MSKIHVLSPSVVAQIAAGEVIERPAFVVKELVENALDAQATQIKISIAESGLSKILVTDNGEGMDKEDLLSCFKPNTTSKISDLSDLGNLTSLGFRGEALHSIATTAKLSIKSKPSTQELGYRITVEQGKVGEIVGTGMPTGTSVLVEDLFAHTPVRKRFLKSKTTEWHHILELVEALALANPAVSFQVIHNEKLVLDLPTHKLAERVRLLMGETFAQNSLPVTWSHSSFGLEGFIGIPQIATAKAKQIWFVNQRWIRTPKLTTSVKAAYKTLLDARVFPPFVLSFSLPPQTVDVNIHPRKQEVNFMDLEFVQKLIVKAIEETLTKQDISQLNFQLMGQPSAANPQDFYYETKTTSSLHAQLRESLTPWHTSIDKSLTNEPILQIENTYLIIQSAKGLTIIDQHAAHERILFGQFLEQYEAQKHETIDLEHPFVLNLSPTEFDLLKSHAYILKQIGFRTQFSDNLYTVTLFSLPKLLIGHDHRTLLSELLTDLHDDVLPATIDTQTHRTLQYLACRTAIKAGEPLNQDQRRKLVEKLEQTAVNSTCPHGRPVRIEVSVKELEKWFRRR